MIILIIFLYFFIKYVNKNCRVYNFSFINIINLVNYLLGIGFKSVLFVSNIY